MKFNIPQEIKQVNCHLTWMGEIIPLLELSVLEKSETMEDHIRFLENKNEDEEGEYWDQEIVTAQNFEETYNEQNPKFNCLYADRLNEATKLAYLLEFEAAGKQLELLEILYHRLEPCHKDAFKYAVDVMQWCIGVLKNVNSNSSASSSKDLKLEPMEDAAIFEKRWKELRMDDKSKACFKYMWGSLGASLKITEEWQLAVFQEVVSLDPDYHLWYAEVYRVMVVVRRNYLRGVAGKMLKPGQLEQQMCEEAYNLKPGIYLSIKYMAVFLKESLWGESNVHYWDRNEETYLRCWNLFKEALKIARERKQAKWTKQIQVYLAEFLLFGGGRKLDQEEGKRLLDQCLEDSPKDTHVLHKMGKLCFRGAYITRKYQNMSLSGHYYSESLKSKPTNYPCILDYLRLLEDEKRLKEYVQVVDVALKEIKRDFKVASLKIYRGCVIWIFNPFDNPNNLDEACESWLHVLMKLPDFAQQLYLNLRRPKLHGMVNINKQQLVSTLERLKNRCESSLDTERFSAIEALLEEAKIMEQEQRTPPIRRLVYDHVPEWRRK